MVWRHTRFASRTRCEPRVVDARPGGDGHLLDLRLGCPSGVVDRSSEAIAVAFAAERVGIAVAWRIQHAEVGSSGTRQPRHPTWLFGTGCSGGAGRRAFRP